MTLNDAVKKMRGKPNTPITLTIARKGEPQPIVVTLMRRRDPRAERENPKVIEPGYGWVRVSQFQEQTPESLARHLETMFKQGPLKGLVLDLRNDPGGLLYGAGLDFRGLPARQRCWSYRPTAAPRTRARSLRHQRRLPARQQGRHDEEPAGRGKTVPMVVLVNGDRLRPRRSSPARCRTTSALPWSARRTFGKGSVQTIMPLGNNTAIKLTTARYYTPNGRSIQAKGITPDVIIEEPGATLAARVREADLTRHLENSKGQPAVKPAPQSAAKPAATPTPQAAAVSEPPKPVELGSKEDFSARAVDRLLKGEPLKGQAPAVAQTKPAVKAN